MNILIKSAKIIDPKSKYNNKICDVFIKDGKIDKIAKKIKSNDKNVQDGSELIYSAENLHISPGWFDLHSNFGEPGYEQKETLETGSNAALKGGFTGVMVMPNNKPSIDNKSMINFIRNATKDNIVDVIPAGNITITFYEIDDGNVTSISKKNLIIEKRGLANKLELLLTQQSFFYVFILVIFSIIFSLLSNLIFRKK